MKRPILYGLVLAFTFYFGWVTPRNRYQLFRYETENTNLFLNVIRMDTWTGEIQSTFTMPDPSGRGTIGDYWQTIYIIKNQKTANDLYELRKRIQQNPISK